MSGDLAPAVLGRQGGDVVPAVPGSPTLKDGLNGVRVVEDNPFINTNRPLIQQPYELFKFVVLGVTLLPVRAVVMVIILLLVALLAKLATLGFGIENDRGCFRHSQPLSRWRTWIVYACAPCVQLLLVCLGFYRVKLIDRRSDKRGTPNMIVAAPHLTNIDVLMLNWAFPPMLSGVGDRNILKAPLVSWIGEAQQGIFIDLQSKESREAGKDAIKARASSSWTGFPTLIFPEGRITNGKVLIQFKAGAFAPGTPVQPVVLRYPHRFFDPTGHSFANKGWMWAPRLMTQFVNFCEIELLEPYVPNEAEREDALAYANGVRSSMANALGIATTEHSYDDAKLFRAALEYRVVPRFEVGEMVSKFNIECKHMARWLKVMQKFDADESGYIDRSEFQVVLKDNGLPGAQNASLFDFLDTDGSGTIEYRELVQCLALFRQEESTEEQALLAFHILDEKGRGKVKVPGFEQDGELGFREFKAKVEQQPVILYDILQPFRTALLPPTNSTRHVLQSANPPSG